MTQLHLIVLLLKVFLIAGFVSLLAWVVVYTRLAKWWQNAVGRTLVIETLLLAGLFIPTLLGFFFDMNQYVIGWLDVVLIGLVTPVMTWRSVVWIRMALPSRGRHPESPQMPVEPPGGPGVTMDTVQPEEGLWFVSRLSSRCSCRFCVSRGGYLTGSGTGGFSWYSGCSSR